jgi:hypothetical protein
MISVEEYEAIYGNIGSVYTLKYNGHKYIKKIGKSIYIDDKALVRRRQFHKKIWLMSHDNYYMLNEFIIDSQLAAILSRYTNRPKHNWVTYLYEQLFSTAYQDRSILAYKIPDMLWEFYRITTALIRSTQRYNWRRTKKKYIKIKT